jgi:hypothetical protein
VLEDGRTDAHSQPGTPAHFTRRDALKRAAGGFGALALQAMLNETHGAVPEVSRARTEGGNGDPLAPKTTHFQPRAKRVIWLYMSGGVSQVESFDPKPLLNRDHNKTLAIDNWQGRVGTFRPYLKKSIFPFQRGGKCGTEISDLFPHVRELADELCVIRSMETDHTNHFESTLGMHTGSFSFVRPSVGSWVSFGLGSENRNLPAFLVLAPVMPYAGAQVWGSDFLPGAHQGTRVTPGEVPIANIRRRVGTRRLQQLELALLREANQEHLNARPREAALDARIRSFDTAFGMQAAAPETFDLGRESAATLDLYGLKRGQTTGFGWQCLVARRLVERGVRFVELIDSGSSGNWDQHGDMAGHVGRAAYVDQPIAGLLTDLKRRGLLEDTLVVWTTEFGRTPYNVVQNAKGREHHHQSFSTWLAGAGVRGGMTYGATDDYGMAVAENRVHVHDFHATILHLLGLDHERLTFRHAGRDYRLTDVHGEVVDGILT